MATPNPIVELQITDGRALLDLQRVADKVGKKLPAIMRPVVSRSLTQTRNGFSRAITKRMNVKAKRLKKEIIIIKSTHDGLPAGRVSLRAAARIGLRNFSATQNRRGVAYRIEKGGARRTATGAFLARPRIGIKGGERSFVDQSAGGADDRASGDHQLVFKRAGKARLPIRSLKGPSPLAFVLKNNLDEKVASEAAGIFAKNVRQRIDFELRKHRL